jgi:hypothetical protein
VHKSMFTACVHDVQNGLLDLCVGDFWLTPERLELAPFTTPVALEHLHLFAVSSSSRCDLAFPPAPFCHVVSRYEESAMQSSTSCRLTSPVGARHACSTQEKTLKRAAKVYEVFDESLWATILVGAVTAGGLDVWLNNAWKPAKVSNEPSTLPPSHDPAGAASLAASVNR